MTHILNKKISVFLCIILAITTIFTSCSSERVEYVIYIDSAPLTLDPQATSTPSEITSALHIYKGLFRKTADGKIATDAAQDYTLSPDGLVYTITLKAEQFWQSYKLHDKTITPPLTAHDFVFGIKRVFMRETKSPYTDTLSSIKNSNNIINGQAELDSLGVRAINDLTLEITLSHPDPMFLERLCSAGAMPCNQEFFISTNGSYGLSPKSVLENGSFTLYSWQAGKGIGLSKIDPAKEDINYLRMIVPSEKELRDTDALFRLNNEITSGELVTGPPPTDKYHYKTFSTTTWTLVFNCSQSPFNNADIRTALSLSAHAAQFLGDNSSLEVATGLVPPSVTMLEQEYRKFVGNTLPTGSAVELFRQGMTTSGLKKLSNVTVLVPNNTAYTSIFAEVNQQWQKDLSVFFSVSEMSQSDVLTAVEKGNFQIALVPLTQSENDVLPVLSRFSKANNISKFNSEEYNAFIKEIENTPQGAQRASLYKEAEQLLLRYAPVAPLFYETSTYLYPKTVENIVINPYGPIIDITKATISG